MNRIPKEIELVIQQSDNTCTSACLSMISGISYDEVVSSFHNKFISGKIKAIDWLRNLGFIVREFGGIERHIRFDSVYLLMVPSLNKLGRNHSIVVDSRSGFIEVYDPRADGVHKYYTYNDEIVVNDPLAYCLAGFAIEVEIF
jgi:ABC-type bacteriocin/lantibiotic exporter with double-glycine peptidase domain